MTLAERIVDHCTPANRVDGYGSLMGATLPLRRLVDRFFGRRFEIATGVELQLPVGCQWQASDQADGTVLVAFLGPPPVVAARQGPLSVTAEVTAIALRMGAAAAEVQACLRHFPDFTLTIPLGGRDEP